MDLIFESLEKGEKKIDAAFANMDHDWRWMEIRSGKERDIVFFL